jgi:hypothetical protein
MIDPLDRPRHFGKRPRQKRGRFVYGIDRPMTRPWPPSESALDLVLNKANQKVLERFEQAGIYHNGYYANHSYRSV